MQRGGGPKKRFQYCVDPISPDTPLYLRAIQGHSGGSQIDPALQDNVSLPNDFADYIYHVGSSHDLHSIIQSELIPGGKDVKKGRHAVFFMAVNPMLDDHTRQDYDLTKPRIVVYNHNRKVHQNTVYRANLKVAQKKGFTFYQTRSNAMIILHNTLPQMCIEKMVVMNSGADLYNQVYESLHSPRRIVLKPALHDGRQDTASIEERASDAHSSKCRETCSGEIDYRIQGLPFATVQQEDHTRKEAVKKLIHQFETHPNREALKVDLRQITLTTHSAKSRKT